LLTPAQSARSFIGSILVASRCLYFLALIAAGSKSCALATLEHSGCSAGGVDYGAMLAGLIMGQCWQG
jgi:hypothetical protein